MAAVTTQFQEVSLGEMPPHWQPFAQLQVSAGFEPTLKAIRTRRNQTQAHLDARPFIDPAKYVNAGKANYRQIYELFDRTEEILNKFSLLYHGKAVPLYLEGCNDYEQAIELLATGAPGLSCPRAT